MHFPSLPPLSLYVHLPWCVRKCPYCDFNSYETKGELPDGEYVDALLRDLDSELTLVQDRELKSVFIGGGTPSLFSGAEIARLITGVRARLALSLNCEITLEANPGSVEASRFAEYRGAGVNRLSIGVQSFRDPRLVVLGRVHRASEAIDAYETAKAEGFDNINLDLMYALPGDDADGALHDLEIATALAPAHLSWYQLTLEPNTAFYRRPPPLPSEDVAIEIEERGRGVLAACGYQRYEISAYAKPGRRSVHNLNYWQYGDYIGIGAGAHGKVTSLSQSAIVRRSKARNPRSFMDQAGSARAVTIEQIESNQQVVLEFMMNALRLVDGVSVECYEERTGMSVATIDGPVREAVRRGWISSEAGALKTTPGGLNMVNSLLALF
jgi:oxygen-independent coproporphyrinogen-3 oxidase